MNLFGLNNPIELEIFDFNHNFDDRSTGQLTERQNNDFIGRRRRKYTNMHMVIQ